MPTTAMGGNGSWPRSGGAVASQTRALWLLVGLVALATYVLPLACRFPLLDPDEGMHASIAQEMVERGDYVTPRLLGQPFFDKPILYFWLQAASLRVFGMHEAAVRLPGLLCGLAGALTTALLAQRLFGGLAAPLSALIYMSTILPTVLAQAAVHDVALVPCTNLALVCLWSADQAAGRGRAWLSYLACGGCLGLAILTKGLIGPALVLPAFGVYLLAARRLRWQALFGLALACAVAALVAAPWYLAMHVRHPGYLHYFFIERHLQGYVSDTQRHGQSPWWYYLPVLVGGGLPWTIQLPTIAVRWRQGRLWSDGPCGARPWLFLSVWLAGGAIFLSVAGSKLWTYSLPLFPALALLATGVWVAYLGAAPAEEPRWYRRLMAAGSIVGPLALPIGMVIATRRFSLEFSTWLWIVAALIGASSLATAILWQKRRYFAALAALEGSLVVHFLFAMWFIVPPAADKVSAVALAEHFNRTGRVPEQVVVLKERVASLIFYLRPDLRAQLKSDQIRQCPSSWLPDDPSLMQGAAIAIPDWAVNRLPADSPLRAASYERVGRYRLYDAVEVAQRTAAAAH